MRRGRGGPAGGVPQQLRTAQSLELAARAPACVRREKLAYKECAGRSVSARVIESLTWSLFVSLLTHGLVSLCVDAYYFIFWDLPGGVLAAPESVLCGWIGVILLSLSG